MSDTKIVTEPIAPVAVTIIGTGDGGTPMTGTTAVTPGNQPNLLVTVVTPIRAISIRFINAYLAILAGIVIGGMTTNIIPAKDFMDLLVKSAGLSIAGAVVGFLKDLVTVFGKLEQKYPLLTGNV